MRVVLPFILLACLLQGCGQKGGLYIPTAEQLQAEEERQRRIEARMARERSEREASVQDQERQVPSAAPAETAPPPPIQPAPQ